MYFTQNQRNHKSVSMTAAQESEVNKLVELFAGMGFAKSADISRYIRTHKLGRQFPNVAGYLKLSSHEGNDTWEFEGGIKPCYYAEVCRRLELSDQGSRAHVTGFESFRDRQMRLAI